MATKNNPGAFQCYQAALPDEEIFTILGRDLAGPATLRFWATERVKLGLGKTEDDLGRVAAALNEADAMSVWRQNAIADAEAHGEEPIWRQKRQIMDDGPPVCIGEIADQITIKQGLHELLRLEGGGFDGKADHVKKMTLIGKMIDAIDANTEHVPSVFEVEPVRKTLPEVVEAHVDMATHYRAWRTALSWAIRAAPHPTADQDDASYWRHEREVLDRTFRALGYASGPLPMDITTVDMKATVRDSRDDVTTKPGGEPYTVESLDEADIWVCQLEGFRVWQDLDGDKQLWFSQALDPHGHDWSGAFKINRSLQSEIIRAMFDRICDDEDALDDPTLKPNVIVAPDLDDQDAMLERFGTAIIKLKDGRLPAPYDLYRAVKRENAFGWAYEPIGLGVTDLEALVDLLERPRDTKVEVLTHGLIMVHGKPMDIREIERRLRPLNTHLGDRNDTVVDTAPEDLAHAPEVPPHRFSTFVKHGRWAYARGLEVNPSHLPRALEAMSKDGWDMVSVFGQTDSQHIGFIFKKLPKVTRAEVIPPIMDLGDMEPSARDRLERAMKTSETSRMDFFAAPADVQKAEEDEQYLIDKHGIDLGRQQEP